MPVSEGGKESGPTRETFEQGDVIKNVVFEKGDNGKWVNKTRGTKIIILGRENLSKEKEHILASGGSFDVPVLLDTRPAVERSGAYIVTLGDFSHNSRDEGVGVESPRPGKPRPIEIDADEGLVYVLGSAVPLNTEIDPVQNEYARSRFERTYTLDQRTVETMEVIAEAVRMKQPCLLEGETAVSKTSAIEYVAAQTGNEVTRLNLNGQADTSELVGKFVPNDEGVQMQFEELLANAHTLSSSSQELVKAAQEESRALSHMEAQKIARSENMHVSDWTWKNGLVVKAMVEGTWLILDEMNLAEAQVLERINSVLENPPSITLSENGGMVIRELSEDEMRQYEKGELRGVLPLHPNFRIFGTMNPAEYQGRSVMSPAYKDRWSMYKYVDRPTEDDYKAMLTHMVYGAQPAFRTSDGARYDGGRNEPLFSKLAAIEPGNDASFGRIIPRLAKFHTTMEKMAREKEIGRNRREPYIFTRRGLTECVRYIESKKIVDRQSKESRDYEAAPAEVLELAIERYYLGKLVNADDREKATDVIKTFDLFNI